MNIVLVADEKYLLPVTVAARSVFDSAGPTDSIDMLILQRGFSPEDLEKLQASIELGPHRLAVAEFRELDRQHGSSRVHDHISDAAYVRLALDHFVPESWSTCIYLDADTLTLSSLGDADDMLQGRILAAAPDPWTPLISSPNGVQMWEQLGLDPSLTYFNSGVLVIDLDRWRTEKATERCFRFLAEHRGHLVQFDQEIINALFTSDIQPLTPDWNVVSYWQEENVGRFWSPWRSGEATPSPIERPRVRHFEGPAKPWTTAPSLWPHVDMYFEVLDRTVFAGWRPAHHHADRAI